jgi:hypothetical protein
MPELAKMTKTALGAATKGKSKDSPLSEPKKLAAAGIGIAALPVAVEQIAKRVAPKVSDLGGQTKDKLSDAASGTVSNLGDQVKDAAKGAAISKLTPGSSDDSGDDGEGLLSKLKPGSSDQDGDGEGRAAPGQGGGGRRMPIQQSVDVAVPIKVAYNRWTLFEDWPKFMHRVDSVDQTDDTTSPSRRRSGESRGASRRRSSSSARISESSGTPPRVSLIRAWSRSTSSPTVSPGSRSAWTLSPTGCWRRWVAACASRSAPFGPTCIASRP